jgi:S-adenosylmethionine hydrolase
VARTADGHIIVTPDNGALTHVARHIGITEVREIDETINRNPDTRGTAVFHGRDLFGYCAARLASGIISWEQVGPAYPVDEIVMLPLAVPSVSGGVAAGIVDIVDPNFGNAWTNIPFALLEGMGVTYGDVLRIELRHDGALVLDEEMPLCRAFGDVGPGELLAYTNELMNVSFTMNQSSIVERYGIGFGAGWDVRVSKA